MSGSQGERLLWTPPKRTVSEAHVTRFMHWANERHGRGFDSYAELWDWSVSELEQFWADVWDFCGVRSSTPYERVLASREMPGASWFEGARINYAENLLLRGPWPGLTDALPARDGSLPNATPAHDGPRLEAPIPQGVSRCCAADQPAVLSSSELRPLEQLSWGELREQVAAAAHGLRTLGVRPGDRVAAYMPNIPETLVAFLACASIGAVWSSAAPEFGARSVIDRFAQIEPKVLFAVDGYRHGGRDFDRMDQLRTIADGLRSLCHTVMLPYLDERADPSGLAGALSWQELLARGAGAELCFEQVPFEHPLWVLYSSGTTGLPKPIVHGHGGILLEQLKKSILHLDLHPGERMFWFTTTGWMMWNFLVGGLFAGATIVLYDGSPAHPDLDALWKLAQDTQMTCMGLSAGFITGCAKAGVEPGRDFDLHGLRSIGSTGSPLPPEGFRWVYEHVKEDVWLFSTSGGTDVCTAFIGGCPTLPVYEGELQCRSLGAAVESWDEHGHPLLDEVGELVLTEPLPSMPLYLWGDETGERYRESYFSTYPGVWRHGDWVRITRRGGAVIYGRSDSTINRQGVRMGTSEIYRATSTVEEVLDALVVDVPAGAVGAGTPDVAAAPDAVAAPPPPGGTDELRMILFVVLRDGLTLDDRLRERIKLRIREDCSPRHVPNEILQIDEVPRTLSGKALEVPVKRILMGTPAQEAASRESLANPAALEYFVRLAHGRGRPPDERSGVRPAA